MQIEAVINRYSYYYKVAIVQITAGWTQILKDGEWVKHRYETNKDEIVSIAKYFDTEEAAQKFIKTKPFERLMKLVEKGGLE